MSASIIVTGLRDAQRFFDELPEIAEEAAALAINDTVQREGLQLIKKDMRDQVEFPDGYLEGENLKPVRFASKGRLEAVIRGRGRATSLARFAPGQTPRSTRGQPIRLRVKPGKQKILKDPSTGKPSAFLVNLRNGNTGLAVRLKPGETLRKSTAAVKLDDNVYLLYGPSVDQVMRGVADDRADDIMEIISEKFFRQFGRLSRAR